MRKKDKQGQGSSVNMLLRLRLCWAAVEHGKGCRAARFGTVEPTRAEDVIIV